MLLVWVKFLICGFIIIVAGSKLSKYGDAISEKTGLSRAWVGLLLLATITSMPEMASGISAAVVVDAPDMSIGIVLGSNLFNLLIIAILDTLHHGTPMFAAIGRNHILSAALCALVIGIAGIGIVVGDDIGIVHIGLFSISLFICYLISLRIIFGSEHPDAGSAQVADEKYAHISRGQTYIRFLIAAVIVIADGIWLSFIGDEIADVTGWENGFVGSFILAIISSLPELTVCVAALRLGAVDMAIADVFGSNMFNTGIIITATDVAYRKDTVLSAASVNQAATAGIAIVMTGLVVLGILGRPKSYLFRVVSWQSPAILGLYFVGAYLLFIT